MIWISPILEILRRQTIPQSPLILWTCSQHNKHLENTYMMHIKWRWIERIQIANSSAKMIEVNNHIKKAKRAYHIKQDQETWLMPDPVCSSIGRKGICKFKGYGRTDNWTTRPARWVWQKAKKEHLRNNATSMTDTLQKEKRRIPYQKIYHPAQCCKKRAVN